MSSSSLNQDISYIINYNNIKFNIIDDMSFEMSNSVSLDFANSSLGYSVLLDLLRGIKEGYYINE